jgi:hypothetical protein
MIAEMRLQEELIKFLNRKYQAASLVSLRFKEKDVAVKTNKDGNAVLAFIGKKDSIGNIKGERYARTLTYDKEGKIMKDHWELKGKAT